MSIEQYLTARKFAFSKEGMESGYHVPSELLREYLDTMDVMRRNRPGLFNTTITIGKNSRVEPWIGEISWSDMKSLTAIRVSGAKWTPGICG
jgi:hypothetical protein